MSLTKGGMHENGFAILARCGRSCRRGWRRRRAGRRNEEMDEGKGWGWVWGPQDEVGNLNEMTDASRLAALKLVQQGQAYDLGLGYDRTSYKWPGHSPGEIMSFRSPHGVKVQKDL